MNDDQLDRALRAARPRTAADDGWAKSDEGSHAFAAIEDRTRTSRRRLALLRRPRALGLAAGLAAATAAALVVGLQPSDDSTQPPPFARQLPSLPNHQVGPVPANLALAAYDNCDAMLTSLREHTAAHVGPYGLSNPYLYPDVGLLHAPTAAPSLGAADAKTNFIPQHSTTNVQEIGVGEPDIVQTDGKRVVTVSDGVLRVVDAATHKITGTLDLSIYAGSDGAQLLMDGDRVLVLLSREQPSDYLGPLVYRPVTSGTTVLLVDVSGAPRVISTMHTSGGYLDARMVGGTARFVVQSVPKLAFPDPRGKHSRHELTKRNRDIVRHAPLSSWLPTYQVTAHGTTTSNRVPCTSVSHPVYYTGKSLITVYSVDLTGDLADPEPITVASDGTTVYASTTSLYVANTHTAKHHGTLTQLHRFDITGSGRPTYLGSGNTVHGTLLSSYSISEYDGALRVVTTRREWRSNAETGVYVLDADTLAVEGHLGGLGRGEQVRAVRLLGPLGYVVTYRSIDPLFVLDLHDPEHPRMAGVLRTPGHSDYLHPVADGRLLGVGQAVNHRGWEMGLQVSLFDVSALANPERVANVVRADSGAQAAVDPHAFLYWPATRIAVIPMDSWRSSDSGAALVVRVGTDSLRVLGTIHNPAVSSTDSYATGIERTLVIGDELWTMFSSGLRVSDLHTLDRQAWVPFE
ncbi:MAG TPA: beta-propeller domain-containing protein [Jatrophihabitans sp.]|nr:beta-propeller domain-containing protein [Jatrophihabitans sp.]